MHVCITKPCVYIYIHMHVCLSMHRISLEGFTRKQCLPLMGGPGWWEGEGERLAFHCSYITPCIRPITCFLPHLSCVPASSSDQHCAGTSPFHRGAPAQAAASCPLPLEGIPVDIAQMGPHLVPVHAQARRGGELTSVEQIFH